MRERLPRYLALAGVVAMVVGIAATVTLVTRRSHCEGYLYRDNSGCLSYNASIDWSFALIVLGAALLVAAALAGTYLKRRSKRLSRSRKTLRTAGDAKRPTPPGTRGGVT
jgi:predicted lysophospholipase L1 biosynthesis ABC-type transport system permease subunit